MYRLATYNNLSSIYLLILLIISSINAGPITTIMLVTYITFCMFKYKFNINKIVIIIVTPLILMILSGFIGMLSNLDMVNTKDILRDVWLLLNPILLIIGVYYMYMEIFDIEKILKIFIHASVFLAIQHIVVILLNIDSVTTLYQLRLVSRGYYLVAMGLGILLTQNLVKIKPIKKKIYICILSVSNIISFSRASILILLIFIFIGMIKQILRMSNENVFRFIKSISITLILGFLFYFIIKNINIEKFKQLEKIPKLIASYIEKIINSVQEIGGNKFNSMKDIQDNWRSYESYRVLESFKTGNIYQIVFGKGIGVLVDLNLRIKLAGGYYTKIPHFHNGYLYILIKTGIIGAFIYSIYILNYIKYIFRIKNLKYIKSENRDLNYLLISLIIVLIFMTYIFHGIYSKEILLEILSMINFIVMYFFVKRDDNT